MSNKFILILIMFSLASCASKKVTTKKLRYNSEYKFSSQIEDKVKTDTIDWKYQVSATDYATKGDYQNAIKHWDLAFVSKTKTYTKKQADSIQSKYKIVSAVDYIVAQSKTNRVIIINEAHHNSSHRVFTKSLLQKLFDNGYKNLGLEALKNGINLDSLLNDRKYPIQKTGYYIKDPQFGNLVREALLIGYNLFAYETTGEKGGKPREIEQAKNIQKIIDENPNEKFLIHCGFAHVLEGDYASWEKTMAGRLTEYTGINPLTVNQTAYSEKSNPEFDHSLLKALDVKQPSVLLDNDNLPYKYEHGESWTDIAVFHPNTRYINNRPSWLFENGNKNVVIKLNKIDISFPVMVFAFKKGEDVKTAVPIDICEVKNKKTKPHLALKKGKYEIIVVNKEKKARKFDFEVE